jgi:hypothetical protein
MWSVSATLKNGKTEKRKRRRRKGRTYEGGLPAGEKGSDCDSFIHLFSFFAVLLVARANRFDKSETLKEALGDTTSPGHRTLIIRRSTPAGDFASGFIIPETDSNRLRQFQPKFFRKK